MILDNRIYQIALSQLQGIGPKKAKILVSFLGSEEAVFKESTQALSKIEGIGTSIVRSLNREVAINLAKKEIDYIEKNSIRTIFYQDEEYPNKLRHCDDGPVVLFGKGKLDFNSRNIAIVGTRKATPYGKKMVDEFIEDLVDYDVQIISGLAFGIDIHAHKKSLEKKIPTIAVLGTGFDKLHPAEHRNIAVQMEQEGGIITEFLGESVVDASNFPKRNRIVAGISEATVVVESADKGGSMITARLAMDYNRDVFAFPGNADKFSSAGCNSLIKSNKAMLITSAEDVIKTMAWENENAFGSVQTNLFVELNPEEDKIVTALREKGELDIDNLGHSVGLTSSQMALHLLNLELKGAIEALAGKKYKAIN